MLWRSKFYLKFHYIQKEYMEIQWEFVLGIFIVSTETSWTTTACQDFVTAPQVVTVTMKSTQWTADRWTSGRMLMNGWTSEKFTKQNK